MVRKYAEDSPRRMLAGLPMKKGCIIAAVAVVLALIGAVAAIYFAHENLFTPEYRGKRVNAWADQAIHDPDPAARREAAESLSAVFPEMKYGRHQLMMRFCYARPELPPEVIPFLK